MSRWGPIRWRRYTERTLGVGSVLVGRDRELSILLQSVEPLTAVEPGVGKSRLVAEAIRRGAAKDVLWL